MTSYLTTNNDEYVAYAVSYTVKLMRTGMKVNECQTYLGQIAGYPSFFTLSWPWWSGKKDQTYNNTDGQDIISQLFFIVGDFQEFLGLAEIMIDTRTIYNEWYSGDYFESGLYAGKAIVNTFFTGYSIFYKYFTYVP